MLKSKCLNALVLFSLFVSLSYFVSAGDTTTFDVDLIGDQISIDVPSYVYLGNVSRGFRTDEARIDIVNQGNTNIRVSTNMLNGEVIFDNLYFSKRLTGSEANFSKFDIFTLNIDKPSNLGGVRSEYFYARLDLVNYSGNLDSGMVRKSANVKFIAVSI